MNARRRLLALCALWVAWSMAASGLALDLPVGRDGLRGGRDVGSALPGPARLSGAGTLEYAYTGDVLESSDAHHRLAGDLGAAFTYARWLAVALELGARFDAHRSPSDQGFATGTRLATRHAYDLSPEWALALAPALRFPAATSAGRGLRAVSPELTALASYRLWGDSEVTGQLGYRVDRSREAVAQPLALSAADLLAASIADYDQLLLGVFFATRPFATPLGPVTATAEWSWDLGVGGAAPGALESAMRLTVGAQMPLPRGAWAGGYVGVSPSARPDSGELVRIEPRFWMGLSAGITFDERERPRAAKTSTPPPAAVAEPETVRLDVRVTDARGEPVPEATVRIAGERPSPDQPVDAQGRAVLTLPSREPVTVAASAPGFVTAQQALEPAGAEAKVELTLERALPEGEIQGRVRSLRGGPLAAHVEVLPTGIAVDAEPDGTFRVTVPPGDYTLRISAPNHETQERAAKVERLGVTILVIDLRRAAP